jgi:hypothetical protein
MLGLQMYTSTPNSTVFWRGYKFTCPGKRENTLTRIVITNGWLTP